MALGQAFHKFLRCLEGFHVVSLRVKSPSCDHLSQRISTPKLMWDWRYKNPIIVTVHAEAVGEPLRSIDVE